MPIRFEYLLDPDKVVVEPPTPPGTGDRAVVTEDGVLMVKLDLDRDRYAADGKYYEAFVQTPNWVGEGLKEYFAFAVIGYLNPIIPDLPIADQARVSFQLSNDNGVTWRVWVDGPDAWLPATGPLDGVFNDELTVDRRIPQFPFANPKQLRFRIRFEPSANGLQRVVVQALVIYNKHEQDIYEDFTRSLKRYIDSRIRVPMYYMAELAAPSSTIYIEKDVGLDVGITEPITVYNIGTDPGKLTNLYQSLGGPDGRTVTMLGPQIGQIEVNFTGIPEVFVGAEEFFHISKIPSIVAFVTKLTQYRVNRMWNDEIEKSLARLVGREQIPRVHYMIQVVVRAQSSLKREALRMTDEMEKFLDQGDFFPSVANGEDYSIYDQSSSVSEDRIAQGLFVGALNLKILGKTWLKGAKEAHLITEVNADVGSQHTCNLLIPVHLRRIYRERLEIKE